MRIYARLGQRPDALRQFHRLRGVLQAELGVEPDKSTVQLYEDIRGATSRAAGHGGVGRHSLLSARLSGYAESKLSHLGLSAPR